ncbi:5-oxoprolinase subunit B family protein [Streptomyces sp. 6N223]|uniref:5-oxoprolinase subunit B family protein n=1 Tax=Streptomyces sp. 6N223 TaxID=3457412 RepID=UPI003FD55A27
MPDSPKRCADIILRVHRLARTGALIDLGRLEHAKIVAAQARRLDVDGRLWEVIPAARTVYLQSAPEHLDKILARLGDAPAEAVVREERRLIEVPVRYDGQDLDYVAGQLRMDAGGFVQRHSTMEYEVAFFGFAPGQAFFGELPDDLRLPRRSVPRTRVPSGALAIANEFTTVYPEQSPGGWHLIGHRAGPPLWDPHADPPNRLRIGDRIRFRDVT